MTSSISRRSLLAAGGAALTVALAACTSNDPLAKQAAAGDNKGYISGEGAVTEYAMANRSKPIEFSGKAFDGTEITAESFRGKVGIINFWYAACAPCRKEAPDLQALYAKFKDQGAHFVGVNTRDETATAESFDRQYSIAYPSIADKDGSVQLALSKYVPLDATPITLVIDKQGRISSRIVGGLDKSTLDALISTVLAEKA